MTQSPEPDADSESGSAPERADRGETPEPSGFSVVVPVFNGSASVARAVRSALEQSVAPLEVLVVDDASDDFTQLEAALAPLAAAGPVELIVRERNGGPAAARNSGLARARGRWVAFLDADDCYEAVHLERALEAYAQDPDVVMTCTDMWIERDRRTLPGHKNDRWQPLDAAIGFERLLQSNCINTSTVTLRADVLGAVGGFDEADALRGVEDYDLWLRVARQGTIRYLDRPLVRYKLTPGSLSADPRALFDGVMAVFDKLERESAEVREGYSDTVARLRQRMLEDLAYNLAADGDFAGAREAAWSNLAQRPFAPKSYKLMLRALLGRRGPRRR